MPKLKKCHPVDIPFGNHDFCSTLCPPHLSGVAVKPPGDHAENGIGLPETVVQLSDVPFGDLTLTSPPPGAIWLQHQKVIKGLPPERN
mmetsp:Transcript_3597/g.5720  ORF Transcript_3597/g.5720 Transcript_3597/m.5720 type:complete len:88 (+) Transcript_3597:1172-1435(+)